MITYQENIGGIITILPDGRVEFLHNAVKDLLDKINLGQIDKTSVNFDEYIILNPFINLEEFHLSAPLIAFIETTNLCNLRCKHCYASSAYKRPNEIDTKGILKLIDELDEMGVLQVFLSGGEVFAHPDAVELIQHAMSKRFYTQVFTNGLLITEEKLKAIPAGCSFFISFDTASPERTIRGKMDFPKLRQKFEWMKKYGHAFRTAISVHRYNIQDALEIFEWCVENDYPRPQWLETHPVGRALIHPDILLQPEQIEEVFEVYKACMETYTQSKEDIVDNNISAKNKTYSLDTVKLCQRLEAATGTEKCGRSITYINSAGDVYPCSNCMSAELFKAGNIRDKSFKEIWDTGFSEIRNIKFKDYNVCISCPVNKEDIWCQFRCPPLSYNNNGGNIKGCGATEYLKLFMLKSSAYWRDREKQGKKLVLKHAN